jgi:hypothetical protein
MAPMLAAMLLFLPPAGRSAATPIDGSPIRNERPGLTWQSATGRRGCITPLASRPRETGKGRILDRANASR